MLGFKAYDNAMPLSPDTQDSFHQLYPSIRSDTSENPEIKGQCFSLLDQSWDLTVEVPFSKDII